MVEKAVARVPEGNDYIILDRCAGTGNLESALYGRYDKNGDELISHCVVSTYEYYEYKVLLERIGQDVRNIIPPTEANVVYENGKVSNADAMSKDYIDNPLIKHYVDDPNCTIILFENPPYRDASAVLKLTEEEKKSKAVNDSFVYKEFLAHASINEGRAAFRDLSNQFVWSGIEYYLRQPTDSYVVFSPIKYWKSVHLVNKECGGAYIFNRKHFHATPSAISCIYWMNVDSFADTIKADIVDITDDKADVIGKIDLHKVTDTFLPLFEKRNMPNDIPIELRMGRDGYEDFSHKKDGKCVYNDDILAYVRTIDYSPDPLNRIMIRQMYFGARGYYLRKDVYLQKLPLWVAKMYACDNWWEKDTIFNTSDGGDAYTKDKVFLKSCLIYTCLSNQNKCLSFTGSDGRYYRNELCLNTTNGDTVASADLATMTLDDEEKVLLQIWNNILSEAKKTANYNSKLTYGVYQITKELNTTHEEGSGTMKKTVYDYPNLNSYLVSLRDNLKAYYKSHITEKMFKYELLK